MSLSFYTIFIYSEWGKKRWVRGDAPRGWDHVLSLRRHRRFRATWCQHLQQSQCLGNTAYEWSFNRTPVFRIRGRTFSAQHYHNESRPSFVVSSLHQHCDARRHCWASIPCCAPPPPSTHPTTMGNFTHASTRKATDPPTHARPTHKPSFPSTQATRTKIHVSRLAHRITYLFVIIRLTDTSFFLSLSCSV